MAEDNPLLRLLMETYGQGYEAPGPMGDPNSLGYALHGPAHAVTTQEVNALYPRFGDSVVTRPMRKAADALEWVAKGPEDVPTNGKLVPWALRTGGQGLKGMANWLDGRPEVGPDTLAPLGLAAVSPFMRSATIAADALRPGSAAWIKEAERKALFDPGFYDRGITGGEPSAANWRRAFEEGRTPPLDYMGSSGELAIRPGMTNLGGHEVNRKWSFPANDVRADTPRASESPAQAKGLADLLADTYGKANDRDFTGLLANGPAYGMALFPWLRRSSPKVAATEPVNQTRSIEQIMPLYRGEPKTLNADPERAGGWWTRSIDRAKGFAGPEGSVYTVDVPLARMGDLQSKASGTNYILPHDLREQRRLLSELTPPAPTPANLPALPKRDASLVPAVAVDGKVYAKGPTHSDALGEWLEDRRKAGKRDLTDADWDGPLYDRVVDGYVTHDGKFLNREEAARHIGRIGDLESSEVPQRPSPKDR